VNIEASVFIACKLFANSKTLSTEQLITLNDA